MDILQSVEQWIARYAVRKKYSSVLHRKFLIPLRHFFMVNLQVNAYKWLSSTHKHTWTCQYCVYIVDQIIILGKLKSMYEDYLHGNIMMYLLVLDM
jgi:hypothetical protein